MRLRVGIDVIGNGSCVASFDPGERILVASVVSTASPEEEICEDGSDE